MSSPSTAARGSGGILIPGRIENPRGLGHSGTSWWPRQRWVIGPKGLGGFSDLNNSMIFPMFRSNSWIPSAVLRALFLGKLADLLGWTQKNIREMSFRKKGRNAQLLLVKAEA